MNIQIKRSGFKGRVSNSKVFSSDYIISIQNKKVTHQEVVKQFH